MALLLTLISLALLAVVKTDFPIDVEVDFPYDGRNDGDDLTAYRLPEVLDPVHCTVEITPYFVAEPGKEAYSFDGIVEIIVTALEDGITELIIHENVRTISGVTVRDTEGTVILQNEDLPFERLSDYQFLKINLRAGVSLEKDKNYIIRVVYVGHMNETPLSRGVFRGSYRDSDNNQRWYAATHLQPTHSRQAFPSFDEPGFKSTFTIIVNRLSSFTQTYSNMHIAETVVTGDRTKETFITTPRMSAYLVTFHISEEYAVIADNNDNDRSYRILARPNAQGQGQYALEVGELLTAELEEYLGIPYYEMGERMKNDQIASPDWASGATENWGLVTYRELRLLYEEGETNELDKLSIGTITAHELAHKWFGNLITARWWDNVWINEGFASYFEYFSLHAVNPDLELEDQFNIMYLQSALATDATTGTRALQHTVNTPEQVTGHFSGISYSKGASFLMMLKHFLTPDTFRKALNYFLVSRENRFALPEHLYAAFTTAVQEDGVLSNFPGLGIANFMDVWVNEPGFPILNVNVDRNNNLLRLTQERFFINGSTPQTQQLWPIPLTFTTSNSPDFENRRASHIMTAREQTISLSLEDNQWVIFNTKQNGIYRVNYNEENWEIIIDTLRHRPNEIDHMNRAQIVDDVFALMRSERISFLLGFKILEFLKNETDFFVWYPAISGFNWFRNRLLHMPDALSEYDKILHEYLYQIIRSLSYDQSPEDSLITIMSRFYIMSFACNIGHEGCVHDSVIKFNEFVNNDVPVNPNLRRHVYCYGLLASGHDQWTRLYNRFVQSNNQADEIVMLRALGCTTDSTSSGQYLDMILDTQVRAQDRVNAFTFFFMGHRNNAKVALPYIEEHHNTIRERVVGSVRFNTVLSNLAGYLDEEGLQEMEEWLNDNEADIPEYSVGINAIANARNNMGWGTTNSDDFLRGARGSAIMIVPTILLLLSAIMSILVK